MKSGEPNRSNVEHETRDANRGTTGSGDVAGDLHDGDSETESKSPQTGDHADVNPAKEKEEVASTRGTGGAPVTP